MRLPEVPSRVDVLLAAVLTGLTLATLAAQDAGPTAGLAWALAVLAVAPIALRQVAPVLTMSVIVTALAGYALLGYGDFPSAGIGMVVALFTVATLRRRAVAAAMYSTTVAVSVLVYLTVDGVVWSLVVQAALICLAAWVLGESTRRWTERAERTAAEAARAVAEERTRIARELHDVVTHHMSVVSVQAGLASYVQVSDPATARSAVESAGAASRDALQEMRRLLNALRTDDGERAPYGPQPGLARVGELVDRIRGAGLAVEVVRTGGVRELPPGADLCAYRVVQESLTNVLRHAGPAAAARVSLDYGARVLVVGVRDDGAGGTAAAGTGPSHGIRGMRERAELYGGVLEAGPAAGGGGFEVLLRLPVGEPADGLLDGAPPLQEVR